MEVGAVHPAGQPSPRARRACKLRVWPSPSMRPPPSCCRRACAAAVGLRSDSPFLINTMVTLCCPRAVAEAYMGDAKVFQPAAGHLSLSEAKVRWSLRLTQFHLFLKHLPRSLGNDSPPPSLRRPTVGVACGGSA